MTKNEELIKFVDENVLGKADNLEQFNRSLEIMKNYLELKGPLDGEISEYFSALSMCAGELMSMKLKGVIVSTSGFFPKTKKAEKTETPSLGRHYSNGC